MTNGGFLSGIHLPDLGLGAGIALWSFRACARGGAKCCAIVKGFEQAFGDDGPQALANILDFARSLGNDGRRGVQLAMPGCASVTADELSIVACLSSAQARDCALCDAHLSWLFAGPAPREMTETVFRIADYFSTYGLQICSPKIEIRGAPSPGQKLHAIATGNA